MHSIGVVRALEGNRFPALDDSEMACGEAVEVGTGLDNGCLAQPQDVLRNFSGDRNGRTGGMQVGNRDRKVWQASYLRVAALAVVERRRGELARLVP